MMEPLSAQKPGLAVFKHSLSVVRLMKISHLMFYCFSVTTFELISYQLLAAALSLELYHCEGHTTALLLISMSLLL